MTLTRRRIGPPVWSQGSAQTPSFGDTEDTTKPNSIKEENAWRRMKMEVHSVSVTEADVAKCCSDVSTLQRKSPTTSWGTRRKKSNLIGSAVRFPGRQSWCREEGKETARSRHQVRSHGGGSLAESD